MTATADAKRRIEIPQVANEPPLRGPPDVRIGGLALTVTLDLPDYLLTDLRWEVNADSLVIRSAEASRRLHLIVPLNRYVHAGRFLVVANGSIFDVRMERDESPK